MDLPADILYHIGGLLPDDTLRPMFDASPMMTRLVDQEAWKERIQRALQRPKMNIVTPDRREVMALLGLTGEPEAVRLTQDHLRRVRQDFSDNLHAPFCHTYLQLILHALRPFPVQFRRYAECFANDFGFDATMASELVLDALHRKRSRSC